MKPLFAVIPVRDLSEVHLTVADLE